MSDLSAFDVPLEDLRWAREAIQEFDAAKAAFFQSGPYAEFTDVDPETGNKILKIKLTAPLPPILCRKATESMMNTRHAFDKILYAGSVVIGNPIRRKCNFPWRSCPSDLERTLQHKNSLIPRDFWDVLRRQEPYPTGDGYSGGNDAIRELSKMANRKHTVGLKVFGSVSGFEQRISGSFTELDQGNDFPAWDSVNNEMVLAIFSKDSNFKSHTQVSFQVVLNEAGPLNNIPVSWALEAFAAKAEHFAESLRAECLKIIS